MKIENGYLYYNCGCSFKLKSENPLLLDPSGFENDIRRDCPLVWLLLESGNTKGVFQLESRLGQIYAKKMKPKNIEEWAALIALIRPGCLNAQEEDGKSITEHYIKRMYGEEEIIELDPIIGEILKDTQQYIIYQESSIRLGEVLAGMSEAEADFLLRKGIGKKIQKLIQEAKTRFLEGCEEKGIISDKIAEKLFSWIERGGRYSFNKCVTPDTLVQTKSGHKTIEELHVGEFVNTPYGYSKTLNKYDNGIKEIFEITTETGKTLKCTADHKLLCEDMVLRPMWEIVAKNLKVICNGV